MTRHLQFFLVLITSIVINTIHAQNVGIGTETPTATLDINGDVVFRTADLILEESIVTALDVNTVKFSSYRVSTILAETTIAGITAGADGRMVTLINQTGYPIIFMNEDLTANDTNRIITGNQLPVIIEPTGMISMQYDGVIQRWIVKGSSQIIMISVWDTIGENAVFQDGYVGIGTTEPVSPLTMMMDEYGTGLTQIGGIDGITLTSGIADNAAVLGTSTDHILSLNAGGLPQMHIRPDGNVVIGSNPNPQGLMGSLNTQSRMAPPPIAKLTLESDFNTTGWVHVGISGEDTIIVDEAIGGVSSSIGTLSDHSFRFKTNGLPRMTVLPDGRITVGDNNVQPLGQFTVFTPVQSDGIVHASTGGFKLATRRGGDSGTIGTYSPNHFRLICNSQDALSIISPSLNVGIGVPYPNYKLEVNGTIRSKEIIVETANWPDYVFSPGYSLMPLEELEQFIHQNSHLPHFAPAISFENTGLPLGETQKLMMEKIEQLTLYVIALNKEINALQAALQAKEH